jgi:hypothetical protein
MMWAGAAMSRTTTRTAAADQDLQVRDDLRGGPPNMAPSDRLHPFQEWLQAIADLTRAEARGVDDTERGRLSAEVDRARNAVALGGRNPEQAS